jgi:chromosome segregation ATPase
MTSPDDPFGQFEDEATKLLDHMTALEGQMVQYKDSADQLGKAHESLAEIGSQIARHGDSITTAGTQAVESMTSAAAALKPLGTAEVKADLQTMQEHFDAARKEIGSQIDSVQTAAREMSEAAARVDAVQEKITASMTAALEAHSSRIQARLVEQDDLALKQASTLAAIIDSLEIRLQAVEAANQAQAEALMDAIEHSAPIGLFRKKRDK